MRCGFILANTEFKTDEVFDFNIKTPINMAKNTATTPTIYEKR